MTCSGLFCRCCEIFSQRYVVNSAIFRLSLFVCTREL